MSLPADFTRSAGVANVFADDEPQESDDDEEDESEGAVQTIGNWLGGAGDAFQGGVDTALDSGPVPIQDAATYYIGAVSGTEDPASEEGRDETAQRTADAVNKTTEGAVDFTRALSPVPTAVDLVAGPDSAASDITEGGYDLAGEVAFGLPRDIYTASTGIDTRTGERDADVSPYLAIDAATAGLGVGSLLRGSSEVADAARATDAAETAATNADSQTMASRILRGLTRVNPFGGGSAAGRADDVAEGLDDVSSGTRSIDDFDEVADDDLMGTNFLDDVAESGDNPRNLPAVYDDTVRSADDVADSLSGSFADDISGTLGRQFDSVTGSVSRGLSNVADTVRSNPRAAAGGGLLAGGAYAYQNVDPDFGGGGSGGSTGGGGSDDGGGGSEGANPPTSFDYGGDLLSSRWSMSDMDPAGQQTIEVSVTNETNRPATVALYMTAEIDGEEYIVDEARAQRLGSGNAGSESPTSAYQLLLRSPAANGMTGRTRFNLYAEGDFQVTDQSLVELGSETIVIADGRGGEDEANEWGKAQRLYSLQYGWHLFGQKNTEGAFRYMVAGKMEDGATRYLNSSGAVVDAPDFFESEQAALDAHEEWVERATAGETGTDESTRPDGAPDSNRVTQDANGAGGGTLSNITRAAGLSGSGWDMARIARVAASIGLLLYVLNRYGYIDVAEWPLVKEVL